MLRYNYNDVVNIFLRYVKAWVRVIIIKYQNTYTTVIKYNNQKCNNDMIPSYLLLTFRDSGIPMPNLFLMREV